MIGTYGETWVLDWGLVRVFGHEDIGQEPLVPHEGHHTVVGTIMGTVAYMSPEQARGEGVDARSDVWSLGMILYELLAGVALFHGSSSRSILGDLQRDAIPDLDGLTDTPPELKAIVTTALSVDPFSRYPDAGGLVRDLEAWRDGRPIAAWAGHPVQRFWRRLVRRPVLPVLGLLVVVAVGLVVQDRARLDTELAELVSARALAHAALVESELGRSAEAWGVGQGHTALSAALTALEKQDQPDVRGAVLAARALWSPTRLGVVPATCRALRFSDDGRMLWCAEDERVLEMEGASFGILRFYQSLPGARALELSADREHLAIASDTKVIVVRLGDGELLGEVPVAAPLAPGGLVWLEDGLRLVGRYGELARWTPGGALVAEGAPISAEPLRAVARDADRRAFRTELGASGAFAGGVKRWSPELGWAEDPRSPPLPEIRADRLRVWVPGAGLTVEGDPSRFGASVRGVAVNLPPRGKVEAVAAMGQILVLAGAKRLELWRVTPPPVPAAGPIRALVAAGGAWAGLSGDTWVGPEGPRGPATALAVEGERVWVGQGVRLGVSVGADPLAELAVLPATISAIHADAAGIEVGDVLGGRTAVSRDGTVRSLVPVAGMVTGLGRLTDGTRWVCSAEGTISWYDAQDPDRLLRTQPGRGCGAAGENLIFIDTQGAQLGGAQSATRLGGGSWSAVSAAGPWVVGVTEAGTGGPWGSLEVYTREGELKAIIPVNAPVTSLAAAGQHLWAGTEAGLVYRYDLADLSRSPAELTARHRLN